MAFIRLLQLRSETLKNNKIEFFSIYFTFHIYPYNRITQEILKHSIIMQI